MDFDTVQASDNTEDVREQLTGEMASTHAKFSLRCEYLETYSMPTSPVKMNVSRLGHSLMS